MHFGLAHNRILVTMLISAAFRGVGLIRWRRLFQCGHPKLRHLLEGGAYSRPVAY